MRILSSQVSTEFDDILAQISHWVEWSVWLQSDTGLLFSTDDAQTLISAFAGVNLRGIVWHSVSDQHAYSNKIAEHKRTFGHWPRLVSEVVEQTTSENQVDHTRVYSGVG
jgi:hypothetical protein